MGSNGGGMLEVQSMLGKVDLVMGAFSKTFASNGGFLATNSRAAATFVIVKLLSLVTSLRPEPRDEGLGLDFTQHGEEAYGRGEGAILVLDRRTNE